MCRAGFAGRDCLPPSAATVHDKEAPKESGGLGSAGAGVLVALLLVLLLLIGAAWYYRRQYNLKLDVPAVHYRVEKKPDGKLDAQLLGSLILFFNFVSNFCFGCQQAEWYIFAV